MSTLNLLYKRSYSINSKISIQIPTVGEIIDNEDNYYRMVSMLTSMPIDMLVELDSIGIDFTTIDEYQLFLLLFGVLKDMDTRLIFGDLKLNDFVLMEREDNGMLALVNIEKDITIDRAIAEQIAMVLRKIHHLEKNRRKPANKEAKEFLLQRAKQKARRKKRRLQDSHLESLIIAMVNTEQYHYGFQDTRDLTIYQFNESVRQVVKKIDYEHRMLGVYSGTINAKDISQDDLNWLTHK